jgi:iron complex outermembrane receptor protein
MQRKSTVSSTVAAILFSLCVSHSAAAGESAMMTGSGASQENQSPAAEAGGVSALHTVVVTGTREFNRTVLSSLQPIDVLTPGNLAATGATDLDSALRALLPSFNYPQSSITDATDAAEPAQLRGLSPDETLVLVDGKPFHNGGIVNVNGGTGYGSSPVDLSVIPIDAIDHIEVLRDSAAAQYGSAAIAGVINIILKHGAKGGSTSFTLGQYIAGDGRTERIGANGGLPLGKNGWVRLSFDGVHQNETNRAGPDYRYPNDPTYGQVTFHYGQPALQSEQGAINLQYDFTPDVHLYASSLLNHKNVWSQGFFRSLSQYEKSTPAAAVVYPDGYLPVEDSTLHDDNEVIGLRGNLIGWHYDVSAETGGNTWRLNTANTFNYSLGAASPTDFYIGQIKTRESVGSADFKRVFNPGWLSNGLLVAWGLQYRNETFTVDSGDPASYAGQGAQVFPGYTPQDAGSHSRDNQAAYLDLESNLTRKLSAEVAARYEHYSDFGSTTSTQASLRYAVTHAVAVRATASTGFRAPSLNQEYYSNTSIIFTNGVPFFIRTFPVNNPAAVALGAQPLKAEKSHSYTVGLVFTPSPGFYATLDAYQITIAHRIVLSGSLTGTPVSNYLTSVGIPFVDGGQFFNNAVDTRTRGADLVGSYSLTLTGSVLTFGAGFNYNKTEILSVAPNPPQLGLAGLTLPIINNPIVGYLTVGSPLSKADVSARWNVGHWTTFAQVTRYGQWTALSTVPADNFTYPSRYLLDANVAYNLNRWTLSIGGNNITNTYPDRGLYLSKYSTILPYPNSSPFGFSGAYYYGTVQYRW